MADLRIIFMGTPEFAVPSLRILLENDLNVVAVVTAPDKPQGRGRKVAYSAVKTCALEYGLLVLQPTNLKSPDFLNELKAFNANLQVVVAFRMLPEAVWAMPELGTINLHASLLPQYRGAAPINWAIINGETETGVTTFFIRHDIDTGNIIFQEKIPIDDDDTAGTLHDKLMNAGAELVLKTVRAIAAGDYPVQPQPVMSDLKVAPRIHKETCAIDWNNSSRSIVNFVRGLSPYPAAWTTFNGRHFKILKAGEAHRTDNSHKPGELDTDNKSFLHVRTADGWVSILELQAEGKRAMTTQVYFAGNRL
jgi:methionyl-tRNA formyltransferase